mmetsp:Transcript_3579/g.9033  ORF Transcript_3579/g.9033 Transcript_3579/m.9033 type:complete len:213 (+) Transcript_3579:1177-1815(+)
MGCARWRGGAGSRPPPCRTVFSNRWWGHWAGSGSGATQTIAPQTARCWLRFSPKTPPVAGNGGLSSTAAVTMRAAALEPPLPPGVAPLPWSWAAPVCSRGCWRAAWSAASLLCRSLSGMLPGGRLTRRRSCSPVCLWHQAASECLNDTPRTKCTTFAMSTRHSKHRDREHIMLRQTRTSLLHASESGKLIACKQAVAGWMPSLRRGRLTGQM